MSTQHGTPAELTWDRVLSWRMDRHLLDRPAGVDPVAVVGRLAGVQAQVASSAEQAVALRRAERSADVPAALTARTLVRTWAMRGTLHLLRAGDAPAVLSLLASRRGWLRPSWQREFATAGQMDAIAHAVADVLPGVELTRDELADAITERTGDPSLAALLRSGWGALLKPLAWQGLLCNAVARDNRITFTAPSTWLPDWPGLPDPDDAARAAIPAYLAAHGPAGPDAFDRWLSRGALPVRTVRGWFADLTEDGVLTGVRVDGESLHARTADLDTLAAAGPTRRVRLLPGFDQYVLGPGTHDDRVVPAAHRARVSRAAGWIAPVVVAGGRVVGTWSVSGSAVAVELFDGAGPVDRDALADEVAVLSDVLGERLTASVTGAG